MTEVALSVRNIVNRFGSQLVHDDVSFEVTRGEILGLVGGSGSGKSVLLKTMVGLRRPDAGEVIIEGKDVSQLKPAESAALLGVLFQQGALFSSMTVARNVMLPLAEHTSLDKDKRAMVAGLKIGLTGLPPETGEKYPSALSGGMVKRASLARALALDPAILFLDEPTSGLDPVSAGEFDTLVVELNQALGATVVMVTHDLDTLFGVCHRAAILVDKKIIIDTPQNLLKSEHPWVREFFQGARGRAAAIVAEEMHGNG